MWLEVDQHKNWTSEADAAAEGSSEVLGGGENMPVSFAEKTTLAQS